MRDPAIDFGALSRPVPFGIRCAVLLLLASLSGPVAADDYFIESDDYTENEEVTGTFLEAEDYSIMIESLERNGVEFDWGWARTPGWGEVAPPPPPEKGVKKLLGRFKRSGPKTVQAPRELDFEIKSYATAYVAPVQNSAGIIDRELPAIIQDYFNRAFEEYGLKPVQSPDEADLELGLAIVDLDGSTTHVPVYNIRVQPSIELELRLRDRRTGRNLLLIRNQSHSDSAADAALRYANQLVQFLR